MYRIQSTWDRHRHCFHRDITYSVNCIIQTYFLRLHVVVNLVAAAAVIVVRVHAKVSFRPYVCVCVKTKDKRVLLCRKLERENLINDSGHG